MEPRGDAAEVADETNFNHEENPFHCPNIVSRACHFAGFVSLGTALDARQAREVEVSYV